jgi:plasmid rolling circle replication initiator protein Rep
LFISEIVHTEDSFLLKLYYKFNFATEPEGLYRKRLISYGGLLKEIHKELNLDDAEDGDLIHTDDEEKADEDGFSIIAMWNWERKNYFIKE